MQIKLSTYAAILFYVSLLLGLWLIGPDRDGTVVRVATTILLAATYSYASLDVVFFDRSANNAWLAFMMVATIFFSLFKLAFQRIDELPLICAGSCLSGHLAQAFVLRHGRRSP